MTQTLFHTIFPLLSPPVGCVPRPATPRLATQQPSSVEERPSLRQQSGPRCWPRFDWPSGPMHLSLGECSAVTGRPDSVSPGAEGGVNTAQPCCPRVGGRAAPGEKPGCGTGQREMDIGLLKPQMWTTEPCNDFVKHQVLLSDPYHSPHVREGRSFCIHFTDKDTEPWQVAVICLRS